VPGWFRQVRPPAFRLAFFKDARIREADEFYSRVLPGGLGEDDANVARQAYAGLLWSKRFYNYDPPFLEGVFRKVLLNFTWRVNRKDDIRLTTYYEPDSHYYHQMLLRPG